MIVAAGPQWMRPGLLLAIRRVNRMVNRLEVALVRRTGRSASAFAYRTPVLVLETTEPAASVDRRDDERDDHTHGHEENESDHEPRS